MFEKINTETKIGGLFGIIGLIAIIVEVSLNGWSTPAIASGIKDLAGTMVIVVLFLISAKNLMPKKYKLTFEERFEKALDDWHQANKPMISKIDKTKFKEKEYIRYYMLTDPKKFFNPNVTGDSGEFVIMPIINEMNYKVTSDNKPIIRFTLNRGTFFDRGSEDYKVSLGFTELINLYTPYITKKYSELLTAYGKTYSSKNAEITIYLESSIETDDDIKKFIDFLNTMVNLYYLGANMEYKNEKL